MYFPSITLIVQSDLLFERLQDCSFQLNRLAGLSERSSGASLLHSFLTNIFSKGLRLKFRPRSTMTKIPPAVSLFSATFLVELPTSQDPDLHDLFLFSRQLFHQSNRRILKNSFFRDFSSADSSCSALASGAGRCVFVPKAGRGIHRQNQISQKNNLVKSKTHF